MTGLDSTQRAAELSDELFADLLGGIRELLASYSEAQLETIIAFIGGVRAIFGQQIAAASKTDAVEAPISGSCCQSHSPLVDPATGTEMRMEDMTQQTILVVDDEAPLRKLIASNLKVSGYDVHTAADGTEALKLIAEQPFDLLLLDISLPGPDGFQVLDAVRRDLKTPVLLLSGRGRERDKVSALDVGADDYVTKPFGVAELLARVRALLRRAADGPGASASPYRCDGLEVAFGARRARLHGFEVPLTRREYEVLAYLAHNAGKVMLHRQILPAVWGGQYGEEVDYVWTFVQRIRRKLEPDRQHPRYVLTETGVGYCMPAPAA